MDGFNWTELHGAYDDNSLKQKGQWHYWSIDNHQNFYKFFRIRTRGLNSNRHYYLACSGFEIYGLANFTNSPLAYEPPLPSYTQASILQPNALEMPPAYADPASLPSYSNLSLPPSGVSPSGSGVSQAKSIVEELKELNEMKKQGILNEEQFENAKNVLLSKRNQ